MDSNLKLDDKVRLKKDLPDLRASQANIGQVVADDKESLWVYIPSSNPDREAWSFALDEIDNFDEWFEKI